MTKNNFFEYQDEKLKEKYYEYHHECGLRIYIFPKKMISSYALLGTRFGSFVNDLRMKDGSIHEYPAGIAHFLEHKLFSSEDGVDAFEKFAKFGADANAYTSFIKTVYLFSATEKFEESLRQLVSFVYSPFFTDENVEKEKGIIGQEIRMCEDNPYDEVFLNMLKGLYGDCRISEAICGTVDTIAEITKEKLYDCYNRHYSYKNMALVISGDVDKDEIIKIVDEVLPKRDTVEDFEYEIKLQDKKANKNYIEKKMTVGKPIFEIGIKDGPVPDTSIERVKRDIGMSILDEMLFSRATTLGASLYESGLVSDSYAYGYSIERELAFHSISGESDKPKTVLSKIKKHIANTRRTGLSEKDFIRCKRVFSAEFLRDFDSTEDIANNLINFVFDNVNIFDYRKMIEEITFEDVKKYFEDSFAEESFTLSVVSKK